MNADLAHIASEVAHEILLWVGFGTLAGLAAKGLMPGRDPGNTMATIMLGIVGSVVGCGIMAFFVPGQKITPISLMGFILATAGAFILLGSYRILASRTFSGRDLDTPWRPWRRRNSKRMVVQEVE